MGLWWGSAQRGKDRTIARRQERARRKRENNRAIDDGIEQAYTVVDEQQPIRDAQGRVIDLVFASTEVWSMKPEERLDYRNLMPSEVKPPGMTSVQFMTLPRDPVHNLCLLECQCGTWTHSVVFRGLNFWCMWCKTNCKILEP